MLVRAQAASNWSTGFDKKETNLEMKKNYNLLYSEFCQTENVLKTINTHLIILSQA
jgi:hypothetical protein